MSPKQLATSKHKPKSAQTRGYVEGAIARSHVSTTRVLKQAAGKGMGLKASMNDAGGRPWR